MDPISGLLLSVIMIATRTLFDLIAFPFRAVQKFAYKNQVRTARAVIGFIVSASCTYLFGLQYVIEVSLGGGVFSLLLGEVI